MLRRTLKADHFLVAESPAMRAVVAAVDQYADGDAPVLICGEHGTGRELVARILHRRGPRSASRFVAVRPTFEDAPTSPSPGGGGRDDDACERARRALRAASGGTLLVKDVSDLSASSQRTLRRAIGDRRSSIAGGGDPDGVAGGAGGLPRGPRGIDRRSPIADRGDLDGVAGEAGGLPRGPRGIDRRSPIADRGDLDGIAGRTGGLPRGIDRDGAEVFDVQVVATADLDLDRAVDAAIVSREFYQLFAGRRIEVPPLRDRGEDLPELFERWIEHYSAEIGRSKPTVSSRAFARLTTYPWPGNVAELKSIARRLVVRVTRSKLEAGDVDEVLPVVAERVPLEDLAFEDMVKAKLAGLLARIDGYPVHDLYDKVLARVERPLFDLVLAHTGGNQLKAAEILGLNRNTLRKKLAGLGIEQTKKRAGREDRALDGK